MRPEEVPCQCARCGNIERYPGEMTLREVAIEPCVACGHVGKLAPRLVAKTHKPPASADAPRGGEG